MKTLLLEWSDGCPKCRYGSTLKVMFGNGNRFEAEATSENIDIAIELLKNRKRELEKGDE